MAMSVGFSLKALICGSLMKLSVEKWSLYRITTLNHPKGSFVGFTIRFSSRKESWLGFPAGPSLMSQ